MPKMHEMFFVNNTKHDLEAWADRDCDTDALTIRIVDDGSAYGSRSSGLSLPRRSGMARVIPLRIRLSGRHIGLLSGRLRYRIEDLTKRALFHVLYERLRRGVHRLTINPDDHGGYSLFEPWDVREVTVRNSGARDVLISTEIGPKNLANLVFSFRHRCISGYVNWVLNLEAGKCGVIPPEVLDRLVGISPKGVISATEDSDIRWELKRLHDWITVDIYN